jgi:hypothetical protein
MLPPWRRKLAATGAHSGPSKRLANVAISPSTIVTIAPRLCDSTTTRANTAKASVSTMGRAIGNPLAASGAATKTRQSSVTSRTVRLGSLTRSCQARIDYRLPQKRPKDIDTHRSAAL